MRRFAVGLLALGLVACGDSTTAPSFEDISGTYEGALAGLSDGVYLDATFTLGLQQSSGSLSGTYSISGTLDDGNQQVPIQGTGSISGDIHAGDNPSVNLTITPGSCPNRQADFSGSYDSANRVITVTGPVDVFDSQCNVFRRYPMSIVLYR